LGSRRSLFPQLLLLVLPVLVLPIAIGETAFRGNAASKYPELLLLAQLTISIGLPFFVLSTTAPLLQKWFADSGHTSARDPYFLYGASNLGSMLALLAYPTLVEPMLALPDQSRVWTGGYVVYGLLIAACGIALWRTKPFGTPLLEGHASTPRFAPGMPGTKDRAPALPPTWKRRLRWVLLAFVPSSLLLGTTTYISTDIAPIPLLWIIPLALYLLTFILVFAKKPLIPHGVACRLMPISMLILALVLLTGATELRGLPLSVLLLLILAAFFLAALVSHGELARDRPAADYLTEFYLWMSVGGVLGGMFNALIAPEIFYKTGLTEYPLAIVLACLIAPPRASVPILPSGKPKALAPPPAAFGISLNVWDVALPLAVGALMTALIYFTAAVKLDGGPLRTGIIFGLPCAVVYLFVGRPIRYGLGLAALLLAGAINPDVHVQYLERNFFGVLKIIEVEEPEGGRFRRLFHGNTVHGQQSLDSVDDEGRHEPLTYYHRSGPIGHLFEKWLDPRPAGQRVASVGLGTGSLAYYARPGDEWTFYEIDPAVQYVAENPAYFSFLSECRAQRRPVLLGDARLRLQEAADGSYDLIVLDAFNSDSIPMHLITLEALELYRRKLSTGGVIALHVSNRHLRLQPILARLAERAGLTARGWDDTAEDPKAGKLSSQWVIVAEHDADFGMLVWPNGYDKPADARWERRHPESDTPLWTDDFSNLLSAFQW
jgi:hypothetical protein